MQNAQSKSQITVKTEWFDNDVLWEDLYQNKKIGPRHTLKKKIARYLCKRRRTRRLTHAMMKKVLAKAKKIRRSNEKRERYRSKQLIKQALWYTDKG